MIKLCVTFMTSWQTVVFKNVEQQRYRNYSVDYYRVFTNIVNYLQCLCHSESSVVERSSR